MIRRLPYMQKLTLVAGALLLSSGGHSLAQTEVDLPSFAYWSRQLPQDSPPSDLSAFSLAFDQRRRQVILFGGTSAGTVRADTWLWDGLNWKKLAPPTSPPARWNATLGYDAASTNMILFGGTDGITYFSDTWAWNGITWTQIYPLTTPPGRAAHTMATLPDKAGLLFFGGYKGSNLLSDTWTWNGVDWTQLFPQNSPSGRFSHGMATTSKGQIVLFGGTVGGTNSANYFNDTWLWSGTNWEQVFPDLVPTARCKFAFAQDVARNAIILFGGVDEKTIYGDTWEWDGSTWKQYIAVGSVPPKGYFFSAVFDPKGRNVLLLDAGQTWTWALHPPTP